MRSILFPKFLKQIDNQIRVNHYWLWITQFHYILYYFILSSLLNIGVTLMYFPKMESVVSSRDMNTVFAFFMVPIIIALIGMFIRLAFFNSDKQYGKRKRHHFIAVFGIYMVSFFLPFLWPVQSIYIINKKVSALVSPEELKVDKMDYWGGLLYKITPDNFAYYPNDSTYQLYLDKRNDGEYYLKSELSDSGAYSPNNSKMVDSIFYQKGVFKGRYIKLYRDFSLEGVYNLNDKKVERKLSEEVVSQNLAFDKELAQKRLNNYLQVVEKYKGIPFFEDADLIIKSLMTYNYVLGKYHIDPDDYYYREQRNRYVDECIDNIHDAHNHRYLIWDEDFWVGMFFAAFSLALVYTTFKNTHWKSFLWMIFWFALIPIFLVLIEVLTDADGHLASSIVIALVVTMFVAAFMVKPKKVYDGVSNQLILWFNIIMPWIPILFLVYLDQFWDIFHIEYFDQYKETYWDEVQQMHKVRYTEAYFILKERIILATLYGGLAIYWFIGGPWIKELLMHLWALPKKK